MALWLTADDQANRLLDTDPFALLIGMTLDQQYPMEAAFAGPQKIAGRMDGFDVRRIAEHDPEEFVALASTPPAIHRFPGSMARRVQELARIVMDQYGGRTDGIWTEGDPNAAEVFARLKALPGWGDQKAKIFVALLAKQRGVPADGWREVTGGYGEDGSFRSVADVTGPEALLKVRAYKQEMKAAAKSEAATAPAKAKAAPKAAAKPTKAPAAKRTTRAGKA